MTGRETDRERERTCKGLTVKGAGRVEAGCIVTQLQPFCPSQTLLKSKAELSPRVRIALHLYEQQELPGR